MKRIFQVFTRYFVPLLITSLRSVIAEGLLQLSSKVGAPPHDKTNSFDRGDRLPEPESPTPERGNPPISTGSQSTSHPLTDGIADRQERSEPWLLDSDSDE